MHLYIKHQVLQHLQSAFNMIQSHLSSLKLVLNVDKTKAILFSNQKTVPAVLPCITSSKSVPIEFVDSCKYLGFLMHVNLSFKAHTENLSKRLTLILEFLFRNKSCLNFNTRKRAVALIDYGDIVYMNASASSLQMMDVVYHGALRFITGCDYLSHHCTLYSLVSWSSLSTHRLMHWYNLTYKSILGLLPA